MAIWSNLSKIIRPVAAIKFLSFALLKNISNFENKLSPVASFSEDGFPAIHQLKRVEITSKRKGFGVCLAREQQPFQVQSKYGQLQKSVIRFTNISNQTIWENRYITISNRPYIWSNWAAKGIVQIHDIIKGNGDFLNHNEIKEKYDINCNFLNSLQIRHSLPMEWRQLIRNKPVKTKINEPFVSLGGRIVPLCDIETNTLYKQFIKYKYKKPTGITRWNATATVQISDDEWPNIFQRSYQSLRETKIQSLQFKIIHNKLNI